MKIVFDRWDIEKLLSGRCTPLMFQSLEAVYAFGGRVTYVNDSDGHFSHIEIEESYSPVRKGQQKSSPMPFSYHHEAI